eukprot:scaffold1621_cov150-Pinguiococcus_pyrenoidosus.AAC.9
MHVINLPSNLPTYQCTNGPSCQRTNVPTCAALGSQARRWAASVDGDGVVRAWQLFGWDDSPAVAGALSSCDVATEDDALRECQRILLDNNTESVARMSL